MHTQIEKAPYELIQNSPDKRHGEMLALYVILVRNRDYETNLSKTSYNYIQEYTGWGREKIASLIKSLKEAEVIDYVPGNSKGYSNLYAFPTEVFKGGKKSILPDYVKKKTPDVKEEEVKDNSWLSKDQLKKLNKKQEDN